MKTGTKIKKKKKRASDSGKLRIGSNWSAINIIAQTQTNPLKAVAEFIENSIDAKAKNITIIRGKERGKLYLKIKDDGEGIPRDENGIPDFKYVATHICDSIKKRLKKQGAENIQGEFGIGLLSFWVVGHQLILTSAGTDNKVYQMTMTKDKPGYSISRKRVLFDQPGTELMVYPLLSGNKQMTGEKIQNYLSSELRDRIRKTNVRIKIIDRNSRKEFIVQPRRFQGILLHNLPTLSCPDGDIYCEIYLNVPEPSNQVGLYRAGTRVLESISQLEPFNSEPWTTGYLQGIIDAPFLHLTPGTRSGIIQDKTFSHLCHALQPLSEKLLQIIKEQKQAEEEKASQNILKSIQKALKEAFLMLPQEEYDWLDIYSKKPDALKKSSIQPASVEGESPAVSEIEQNKKNQPPDSEQKQFFEFPGPLHQVLISPASCIMKVKTSRSFRAVCRDKRKRTIDSGLSFSWQIAEGQGILENSTSEIITFHAPDEPCLTTLRVSVCQNNIELSAENLITITEELLPKENKDTSGLKKGLPGYTYKHAPGELWRSRYDKNKNIIVINNGHSDFIFASKNKARKLRYICRLFAKELVLENFPGMKVDLLLERMIELTLYTEENLK